MGDLVAGELEAIRQRAEKATPGPWYSVDDKPEPWTQHNEKTDYPSVISQTTSCVVASQPKARDAHFIAHARTDIPALLARVGLLVERNQQLEAENEQLKRVAAERAAWLLGDRCNCGVVHRTTNLGCPIAQTVIAFARRQELADDC